MTNFRYCNKMFDTITILCYKNYMETIKTGRKGGQINNKNAEKWTEEIALTVANNLIEYLKKTPKYYQLEDGSLKLDDPYLFFGYYLENEDLDDATLAYLSQKFESFSKLMKKANKLQREKLMKLTSSGVLNSTFSMFILKCDHGMIESDKRADLKRKQDEFELKKQALLKATENDDLSIDDLKTEIRKLVDENGFH